MALQQGEVYRCTNPECGCEITVTRGAAPGRGGNLNLRCCCGLEMRRNKNRRSQESAEKGCQQSAFSQEARFF